MHNALATHSAPFFSTSLIIRRRLRHLVGSKNDVLDRHNSPNMASDSDPSSRSWQRPFKLKHVIVMPFAACHLPGLAAVRGDLHLGCTTIGILDCGSEPVLRSTAVHVDRQWARNGTLNELPFDAVNTATGVIVGKFGPCVWSHVKVVLVASGKIGDHDSNRLALVADFDLAKALESVEST